MISAGAVLALLGAAVAGIVAAVLLGGVILAAMMIGSLWVSTKTKSFLQTRLSRS